MGYFGINDFLLLTASANARGRKMSGIPGQDIVFVGARVFFSGNSHKLQKSGKFFEIILF